LQTEQKDISQLEVEEKSMSIFIHHNPECVTSRNVLEIVRGLADEPIIIEYLQTGRTRPQLQALFAAANLRACLLNSVLTGGVCCACRYPLHSIYLIIRLCNLVDLSRIPLNSALETRQQ
jgi:hypothetical protein